MEFENVKKAHKIEEPASDAADSMPNGRPKRSRVAEQRSRFGSADGTISNSPVSVVNTSLTKVQSLMGVLGGTPPKEGATLVDVCRCVHHNDSDKLMRGSTVENAVEIDDDDDDDDVKVVAILPRPLLQKNHPSIDEGGKFRDAGILTAEEISGHQRVIHEGRFAVEDQVLQSHMDGTNGNYLIHNLKDCLKEAKIALNSLKTSQARRPPAEEKPVSGKMKEGNVDDQDDVEERMFSSPRGRKTKDVVYAGSDEDEPDYEIRSQSDSDREPSPEPEDPNEDTWKEILVMARQSKREDVEEVQAGCEHEYVITNDVGKACSICGLIKEDIKDMSFVWRRPLGVQKGGGRRGKPIDSWDGDGDEVLEEEAQLVGMAALEAHPCLESEMHPHQSDGFKFLSRNLVQEDSGGCMLAFAPGTGKSFLVICFIQSFMVQVPTARPMIVAPKIMLRPWMEEFKKWQVEEIKVMNLYEAENQVEMLKQWQETSSVLLVGYSQCTNMSGEVGKYLTEGPGLLVLDEGHLARTESTKILKSLSRVHTKRRVLLSGTPFNNNFEEFYTTLELVRPNFMMRANPHMCPTLNTLIAPEPSAKSPPAVLKKSSNAGRQAFKDVIGEKFESGQHDNIARALRQLRMLIEPFVAWHKGQILKTLPGITDLTIMLKLSPQQLELLKECDKGVKDSLQKRAAAIYVHPILEPVAEHGKRSQKDPRLKGNIDVNQGAKLRWVLELAQFCDDAKEKMLIFSEYLYTLQLIENMAAQKMKWTRDVQILRLDGKLPPQEREKVIKQFNTNPDVRMLCGSIKACGEGISLVGASRVVILEVMWNPAVTRQAISRAFRIGQQRKVVVYRLIAADTYEEHRMHAAATRKEWLSKLLFDPTISCEDPSSILSDVYKDCPDSFLTDGPLRVGVTKILQREF